MISVTLYYYYIYTILLTYSYKRVMFIFVDVCVGGCVVCVSKEYGRKKNPMCMCMCARRICRAGVQFDISGVHQRVYSAHQLCAI